MSGQLQREILEHAWLNEAMTDPPGVVEDEEDSTGRNAHEVIT